MEIRNLALSSPLPLNDLMFYLCNRNNVYLHYFFTSIRFNLDDMQNHYEGCVLNKHRKNSLLLPLPTK